MAAVKGIYQTGKSSGMVKGVKHDSGKTAVSHGSYPTHSMGKNSGTARGGDKSGCSPMGNGKSGKSC